MSNINPCPFCGGKAELRTTIYEGKRKGVPIDSYVTCTKCFAMSDRFLYKNTDRTGANPAEAAVNAWNRREGEKDG